MASPHGTSNAHGENASNNKVKGGVKGSGKVGGGIPKKFK